MISVNGDFGENVPSKIKASVVAIIVRRLFSFGIMFPLESYRAN